MLKKLLLGASLVIGLLLTPGCNYGRLSDVAIKVSVTNDPNYKAIKLLNEVALPTYKVIAKTPDGTWSGSAVAINEDTLLTAAHVVLDPAGAPIENVMLHRSLDADVISEAVVVKLDADKDIAILKSKTRLPNWAKVLPFDAISETVTWMAPVVACGNSLGLDDSIVSFGYITSLDDTDQHFIRHNAHTLPGNSGGPVFVLHNNRWKVFSIHQANYLVGFGTPSGQMGLSCNPYTLTTFIEGHQ